MATESPGWCKRCGEPIEQSDRTQGRAREFCGDACRQAHRRAAQVRSLLAKEVGLTDKQTERLLTLFKVSIRDASASRSGSREVAHG
ncbi:hypothetical protein QQX13_12190 [Demequina sp. SYSU T00068]|uniref:hypothetical protein n=1 Tax=Demequina lignilytica TaxID=3051663 RepID=UPI002605E9FD|nr:hypothetical protein [Demequina sp. SYSU T00068]MDN4491594.1 hypothetical protein [Demequina sp. SYSU T00068]